jgi:hypothetical protein
MKPSRQGTHREVQTTIAFDEGTVPPAGTYAFDVDLSGQNGCEIIDQLTWLMGSLRSPYEIRAGQQPIGPEDIGHHFTRLTVWTNDRDNADFLLLLHELGVDVVRAIPAHEVAPAPSPHAAAPRT